MAEHDKIRNSMQLKSEASLITTPSKSYGSATEPAGRVAAAVPTVCLFILAVELCERLAYYTFTGTAEFFLVKSGYSLAQANGLTTAMATLCMAWAIVAGWVADVQLGRYTTIITSGVIYALGGLLVTTAAEASVSSSAMYLFGLLVLVPIGTAGIKANISNFGADQYDTSDPAQALAQEQFFQWFYMSINIGSAVAYGFLTTIATNGGMGIPKESGYFAAYLTASLFMVGAVVAFISMSTRYCMSSLHQSSAMSSICSHVMAAVRAGSSQAKTFCAGVVLATASVFMSVAGAIFHAQSHSLALSLCTFTCAIGGVLFICLSCEYPDWLPDREIPSVPLRACEARGFLRLLPVIITSSLAFGALYNCMQYSFQQQACQMDLRIPFIGHSQFAGSFFMIADCLGIAIATPLAVGYVNPALEAKLGSYFSHGGKFGFGMAVGAASVATASYLELTRRGSTVLGVASNCAPDGIHMSDLSAVYMLIPFFLMGIGEIYTNPVMMHLAYSNSSPSTRTLAAVACLLVQAISNAIFGVQVLALSKFMPNDLNEGHIEYGYYLSMILAWVLYMAFVRAMKIFETTAELREELSPPDLN